MASAISEIAEYAIILLDTKGNIKHWNKGAEKIKGYQQDEILGKNFKIFYTKADLDKKLPDALLQEALLSGKATSEGWRVRKDGSQFWGSIILTSTRNEQGEVVGVCKITRDLTLQKLAEQDRELFYKKLESKNRELEQFAYIASHDLQEPLITVSNMTTLLHDEYWDRFSDNDREVITYLNKATSRMKQLVRGLLDYSRLGVEKSLTKIDTNKLIEEIEADLSFVINEAKATIIKEDLPKLECFETEFRLLLQNLISNAIKFRDLEKFPEIQVKCESMELYWKFSITDNGLGIEKKYWDKIFVIFQRLQKSKDHEGTGIGLAHCRKIVEMHHGTIWVESEPSNGSTFYFTISKKLKIASA